MAVLQMFSLMWCGTMNILRIYGNLKHFAPIRVLENVSLGNAATVTRGPMRWGIGTVFGAVVGATLIEVVRNGLTMLGISSFWQGAFVGSIIVLAVAFDRVRANRKTQE